MNFNDCNEEQEKILCQLVNSINDAFNDFNRLTPKYREKFFQIIFSQYAEYMRKVSNDNARNRF